MSGESEEQNSLLENSEVVREESIVFSVGKGDVLIITTDREIFELNENI